MQYVLVGTVIVSFWWGWWRWRDIGSL